MDDLPEQCNYLALGAARIREIKAITKKLKNCEHGNRVFQNLPRHMQRRAVSSNAKRLPRELRERHMREGGANVKPSFRPRRKYRRRPRNLLEEYNRRQRQFIWLETHIWHAKRFHMTRQWGYVLPQSPTCKGYRATLRAAKATCLLQDLSFLCCIELEGCKTSLLAGLSAVVEPSCLSTLKSANVQQGRRWMSVMLYQPHRQPCGAIGEVDIWWCPPSAEDQSGGSRLWLWSHTSSHTQVVQVLAEVFHLSTVSDEEYKVSSVVLDNNEAAAQDVEMTYVSESLNQEALSKGETIVECKVEEGVSAEQGALVDQSCEEEQVQHTQHNKENKRNRKNCSPVAQSVNQAKLLTRNVPFSKTPVYSCSGNSTKMRLLKDTLNRFRLIGPKSFLVLSAALTPSTQVCAEETADSSEGDQGEQTWWRQYYHDEARQWQHQQQVQAWSRLGCQPHPDTQLTLPLTVRDPRATLPIKKVPLQEPAPGDAGMVESVAGVEWPVDGPIYDSVARDGASQGREPDAALNQRRAQCLVPGSTLPQTPHEARLPLLLLARPSTSPQGYGGGWEVVVPAGWGTSVWLPLVFSGAVPGGQTEAENLHLEMSSPLPPHLLPDTPAGASYARLQGEERRNKFFSRPPAKRHNYIKLGVQFPFGPPWLKLVREWQPGTQQVCVLRQEELVAELAHLLHKCMQDKQVPLKRKNVSNGSADEENNSNVKRRKTENSNDVKDDSEPSTSVAPQQSHITVSAAPRVSEQLLGHHQGCLVMVKLVLQYKGSIEPCAMICLPSESDLRDKEAGKKPSERQEALMEPLHEDLQAGHRKKLQQEHQKIKDRLQRLRRKARQKVEWELKSSGMESKQSKQGKKIKALEKVKEDNKEVMRKFVSYKEEMENAWLISPDEGLQLCSRRIMGYTTHGTFCQTVGGGAGLGWVALRPLLQYVEVCNRLRDEAVGANTSQLSATCAGPAVLVRSPSSRQYRWASVSIVTQPYTAAG